jgi:hypothetical protein
LRSPPPVQTDRTGAGGGEFFAALPKVEEGRYQTGIDPDVDVLFAVTTLLANQRTLNSLPVQQMTSAVVAQVEALGGGWDSSQLPNSQQLTQKPARSDTTIQR